MEKKKKQSMPSLLMLWLLLALVFVSSRPSVSSLHSTNRPVKSQPSEIIARHGAIATDDYRCSKIGMRVLQEGGHAVDASVAAALCLGVVSPASSGIGGGAFMLVRSANGKAQSIDMRETAPLLSSENMYDGNTTLKSTGPLSVAIPGELAGLHTAWLKHGRLPWKRLVRPAQRLASRGFRISPYLHFQMVQTESGIFTDKGLRHLFTLNGSLLQPGDVCYNKKLAKTLRAVSKHGAAVFYNGSIGVSFVNDVRNIGGILSMEDLQGYRVKIREPISTDFLGFKILTMPPPSGGPEVILMLNILSRYEIPSGISGSLGIHREIEALKHTFAVRMNLGDPDFINITEFLSNMLSLKFAEELKKTIYDNRTFNPGYYGGKWNQVKDHGTSHLSVIDRERNAVSMTSTVNSYFGAWKLSSSTGIVLNNEMDDFSIPSNCSSNQAPPAPPNFIRPGKRPLSSMAPTIVLEDDRLKGVIGASGGVYIISATAGVLLNHFARRMDPLSSVLAPRVYHQLIPNVVYYENWTTVNGGHFEVGREVREELMKKGHVLASLSGGSICQFIVQDSDNFEGNEESVGELVAVSDPRKGGFPSGF